MGELSNPFSILSNGGLNKIDNMNMNDVTTKLFTFWTPERLIKQFSEYQNQQLDVAKSTVEITMFGVMAGLPIYLTNPLFRKAVEAWPKYRPYMPANGFPIMLIFIDLMNVYHRIVIRYNHLKINLEERNKIMAKITEITECDDILTFIEGMALYIYFLLLCNIFFIFYILLIQYDIFFVALQ